jgi:uncharacterized membrane protein
MALAELRGHWGTAILAYVFYYMLLVLPVLLFDFIFGDAGIAVPVSLIGAGGNGESIFNSFLNADLNALAGQQVRASIECLYLFIINAPLLLGFSGFILSVSRGATPGPGAVLDGFNNFFKAVGTYFLIMLRILLWDLLFTAIFALLFTVMLPALLGMYGVAGMAMGILLFTAVAVMAMVVVFRVLLTYSQTFFLLVDDPRCGMRDAIRQSRNMMLGNKKKLLFLYLSFIGWSLLTFIIVSFLLYSPIAWLAYTPFFVRMFAIPVLLGVLMAPLGVYVAVSEAVFYDMLTGRRGAWPADGGYFANDSLSDAEAFRSITAGEDRDAGGIGDDDRYGSGKDGEDM